ncbi:MAG: amino acid kinase family protein [Hyphomicrobium sp.]
MASLASPPLVVKVGGSLVETGRLAETLEIIASAARPLVVVPGGGAFADKVRDLQRALKFDDAIAHRMAMFGMHQMADTFIATNDAFAAADSIDGIYEALSRKLTPVWLPLPMMEADAAVPADWTTTSDALAARLAERLGGAPLALVKSADVAAAATAERLAADGVVDAAFPIIVARAGLTWRVYGPSDELQLRALLQTRPAGAANC